MITVARNSWHAKLYAWWYRQKYDSEPRDYSNLCPYMRAWYRQKYDSEPRDYSNLCPYMRAVLFWSWMRWLFIGGKVWRVPIPALSWLFLAVEVPRWLGIVSYNAKMCVFIFECAIVGGAAVLLAVAGLYVLDEKTHWTEPFTNAGERVSSFGSLVGAYLRSAHDRICPEVTFTGGKR